MSEPESFIPCVLRTLPTARLEEAIANAIKIRPKNAPPDFSMEAVANLKAHEKLAVDVQRRWSAAGVKLTVGFIETSSQELRNRILSHMNAWSPYANVSFVESHTDPQVRIARFTDVDSNGNGGYWSNLGTDILLIDKDQPTMNLEGFTMETSEAEYHRVVRHETGHTLGFPHEHMRPELVARLDPEKVIKEFMRTQGWTRAEVIAQVLTALDPATTQGTDVADDTSIMCYQIDGKLTRDGHPIPGGLDINARDAAFAGKIYPKPAA